jgi:hypothetical protein
VTLSAAIPSNSAIGGGHVHVVAGVGVGESEAAEAAEEGRTAAAASIGCGAGGGGLQNGEKQKQKHTQTKKQEKGAAGGGVNAMASAVESESSVRRTTPTTTGRTLQSTKAGARQQKQHAGKDGGAPSSSSGAPARARSTDAGSTRISTSSADDGSEMLDLNSNSRFVVSI